MSSTQYLTSISSIIRLPRLGFSCQFFCLQALFLFCFASVLTSVSTLPTPGLLPTSRQLVSNAKAGCSKASAKALNVCVAFDTTSRMDFYSYMQMVIEVGNIIGKFPSGSVYSVVAYESKAILLGSGMKKTDEMDDVRHKMRLSAGVTSHYAGLKKCHDVLTTSTETYKKVIVIISNGRQSNMMQRSQAMTYSTELKSKNIHIITIAVDGDGLDKAVMKYMASPHMYIYMDGFHDLIRLDDMMGPVCTLSTSSSTMPSEEEEKEEEEKEKEKEEIIPVTGDIEKKRRILLRLFNTAKMTVWPKYNMFITCTVVAFTAKDGVTYATVRVHWKDGWKLSTVSIQRAINLVQETDNYKTHFAAWSQLSPSDVTEADSFDIVVGYI